MKILTLDFKKARTKVAICDEKGIIYYPLKTT